MSDHVKFNTDITISTCFDVKTYHNNVKFDMPISVSEARGKKLRVIPEIWPYLLKKIYKPELISKVKVVIPKKG